MCWWGIPVGLCCAPYKLWAKVASRHVEKVMKSIQNKVFKSQGQQGASGTSGSSYEVPEHNQRQFPRAHYYPEDLSPTYMPSQDQHVFYWGALHCNFSEA